MKDTDKKALRPTHGFRSVQSKTKRSNVLMRSTLQANLTSHHLAHLLPALQTI